MQCTFGATKANTNLQNLAIELAKEAIRTMTIYAAFAVSKMDTHVRKDCHVLCFNCGRRGHKRHEWFSSAVPLNEPVGAAAATTGVPAEVAPENCDVESCRYVH